MPGMMPVRSTADFYPPLPNPDFVFWLYRIATPELDANRNFVLRRALAASERHQIQDRIAVLDRYLIPGSVDKIKQSVLRLLISFNKSMSQGEAAAITAQFYSVLSGLPLWCIERSVMRFCASEVKPEEIGAKSINWGLTPTSAQLRLLAVRILTPFGEEMTRLRMTLRGSSPREASLEERVRIGAALKDLAAGIGSTIDQEEAAHLAAVAERRRKATTEANLLVIKAEYAAAGLEPHPGGASLGMMLSCGWSIVTMGDGSKQLVRYADREAPQPLPETKPQKQTTAIAIGQTKSFGELVDDLEKIP